MAFDQWIMLVGVSCLSFDFLLVISLFEIPRREENMVKGHNGGNDEDKKRAGCG